MHILCISFLKVVDVGFFSSGKMLDCLASKIIVATVHVAGDATT